MGCLCRITVFRWLDCKAKVIWTRCSNVGRGDWREFARGRERLADRMRHPGRSHGRRRFVAGTERLRAGLGVARMVRVRRMRRAHLWSRTSLHGIMLCRGRCCAIDTSGGLGCHYFVFVCVCVCVMYDVSRVPVAAGFQCCCLTLSLYRSH